MNLQKRVVGILTNPQGEWQVIAAEGDDIATLYREYVVILAAIPAVCTFLGLLVFGRPLFGRPGFMLALSAAVAGYVSSLVGVILAAVIIEKLAPKFSSTGSTAQAVKLVAYASTPMWVGGVLYLLPALATAILIAGLYAIYLFYLGLTPIMKTPAESVVPFMVVSAIVVIVVSIVLSVAVTALGLGTYAF